MFRSPVYKAVIAAVEQRIATAEQKYEEKVDQAKETYQQAVITAGEFLEKRKSEALEEAVKSVMTP